MKEKKMRGDPTDSEMSLTSKEATRLMLEAEAAVTLLRLGQVRSEGNVYIDQFETIEGAFEVFTPRTRVVRNVLGRHHVSLEREYFPWQYAFREQNRSRSQAF